MVDMVGDLALAGCDLVGRFVAFRSGHRLNAELVRSIVALEEDGKETVKRCA
jgi:UDP-3-O-acyl-N-acetylglucosamine deacetylase